MGGRGRPPGKTNCIVALLWHICVKQNLFVTDVHSFVTRIFFKNSFDTFVTTHLWHICVHSALWLICDINWFVTVLCNSHLNLKLIYVTDFCDNFCFVTDLWHKLICDSSLQLTPKTNVWLIDKLKRKESQISRAMKVKTHKSIFKNCVTLEFLKTDFFLFLLS
jgi:hypothetical protein